MIFRKRKKLSFYDLKIVKYSQYIRSKHILFIRDKAKAFPDIIFIRIRQRKKE